MSELVAIAFDGAQEADRVLSELYRLQTEDLVDLADAVVVVAQPEGKIDLKQCMDLAGAGAVSGGLSGSLWGTLVGLLFLNPLAGFAVGGLAGVGAWALSDSFDDFGIDEQFVRSLAKKMKPNTSALFVLVRKAQPEKVLAALSHFDGDIIRTSLSPHQEERLRTAIAEAEENSSASNTGGPR
jgi:uncharacterized membrane protein